MKPTERQLKAIKQIFDGCSDSDAVSSIDVIDSKNRRGGKSYLVVYKTNKLRHEHIEMLTNLCNALSNCAHSERNGELQLWFNL